MNTTVPKALESNICQPCMIQSVKVLTVVVGSNGVKAGAPGVGMGVGVGHMINLLGYEAKNNIYKRFYEPVQRPQQGQRECNYLNRYDNQQGQHNERK